MFKRRKKLDLSKVYRWCDDYGGGIVIADSIEDAESKLRSYYPVESGRHKFKIWLWMVDDYYDSSNPDVFDIYS